MPLSMLKSNQLVHEELLEKWILLSQIIKNNRLVGGDVSHIEILILYLATNNANNTISVKELIETSKILKSQMNRTLNNMIIKNWIIKRQVLNDKRCQEICVTKEGLNILQNTYQKILNYAKRIVDIISKDDALEVIRIFSKFIDNQNYFENK